MFAQMKRMMKGMPAALVLLLLVLPVPTRAQSQDFKLGKSLELEWPPSSSAI